jgi:hypothetical protein
VKLTCVVRSRLCEAAAMDRAVGASPFFGEAPSGWVSHLSALLTVVFWGRLIYQKAGVEEAKRVYG